MFVINTLPNLQYLDDMAVRATHREHAKKHRNVGGLTKFGDASFNIFEKINILKTINNNNNNNKHPGSTKSNKTTTRRHKNVAGGSGTKKKSNKKKSDEMFECISSTD
jgi:hypothetical protein